MLAPPAARWSGDWPPATPRVAKGAVTVSETLPLKLPTLVKVRVVLLAAFSYTMSDVGVEVMVKSGTAATIMVRVAVWVFVPPVAVRVTV